MANLIGDKYNKHQKNNKTKDKRTKNNNTDDKSPGRPTTRGYINHKLAHGLLGGFHGLGQKCIQGKTDLKNLWKGFKSGSTATIVGEMISEAYYKNIIQPAVTKKALTLAKKVKKTDKKALEKLQKILEEFASNQIKIAGLTGKLTALSTAYGLGDDLEIASRSVNNAIDNNFAITISLLIAPLIAEATIAALITAGVIGTGVVVYHLAKSFEDDNHKPCSDDDDDDNTKQPDKDPDYPDFELKENNKRNPKQDKRLTNGEIKKLKKNGHNIHKQKGNKRTGSSDLYKDKQGNIYQKPQGGAGEGEPLNININDLS